MRKPRFLKSLVIFFILILSFTIIKNNAGPLRSASMDISAPILGSFRDISTFFKRLIPFASYRDEIIALKKRIDYLSRRLEETKIIVNENQRLKDLLNFKKAIPYTTVSAEVIGRDPSNWANSLIIDKGSLHGIRQNKAALSVKGLVGRVAEVGKHSSRILLITDPNSKVGVLIERTLEGGVLVGRPDGTCKMIYIALDSDVGPGDKVMSAGFGRVFPKGILVGEVTKVGKEAGRLYKYAIVKPAENLSRVEEVLCIR